MATNIGKLNDAEIKKKILSMILPITMENVLQMTAGFVSMAMIGRIDAVAIGALGISARITQIIWALFKGITTGASVFVAQAYGAGDYKKLKNVAQQTLISTIVLVIIFQQLIYWKASSLLKIFNPSPDLLANGTMYLKIASFGLPFLAVILVVAGILQGMGNAKVPMKIALIMNFFNVVFSYILIFGHLGFSPLGLKGAGIAIVLAQMVAAFIGLYILFNRDGVLSGMYNSRFFKVDSKQIIGIYKVGLPTSFESIFWQLAAIIVTKVVLTYGEKAFAAYQLGLQAESISYMPAAGFGIAATTFIGQALGAKDKELGKKYIKQLIKGTSFLTVFSAGILIFFPSVVMRILTNDIDVINIGVKYLIVMGFVQIPQNISGVLNGALRGAGFTRVPMTVAGIGLWGIRVPLSLLATYYFKMDITAIWIIIGIDMVFRFILSCFIYKSKDIYNRELLI